MVSPKTYATPNAFKTALEQRIRDASATGGSDITRRRQLIIFDRLLARIVRVAGDAIVLKGGLVLELRLAKARTTKDVDLRFAGTLEQLHEHLQNAAQLDLGDYMRFELRLDRKHPEITNPGAKYGGLRFRAECRIAGKLYGQPFGLDVALGGPICSAPDIVEADDHLAFIDVPPPALRLVPVATHIAEKLHAYSMPQERESSRVKDLPDIALLAGVGDIDASLLRAALEQTFSFRGTHPLPAMLPDPPRSWREPYAAMAKEFDLAWTSVDDVHAAASTFLDPVLADCRSGAWIEQEWRWEDVGGPSSEPNETLIEE